MRLTEAIILAGGLGTRLQSVVKERPKSMALINNRPFLEYLLDHLIKHGIERCIFSVGYKSGHIFNHFGDRYKSCEIIYAEEAEPLGTGGAIKNALRFAQSEDVLITNGDSLFLVDIQAQKQLHEAKKAEITFALKAMQNFDRFGAVELDDDQRILNFQEKKPTKEGFINGGVYIFKVKALMDIALPLKFSIEKEVFQKRVSEMHFYGFTNTAYFLDIGIPDDFAKAQQEFKELSLNK